MRKLACTPKMHAHKTFLHAVKSYFSPLTHQFSTSQEKNNITAVVYHITSAFGSKYTNDISKNTIKQIGLSC